MLSNPVAFLFLALCARLISHLRLLGALLPLHVHDLGELEIGRVGGEQTSGAAVGAGKADLRVDVEQAAGAAGRPDDRCAVGLVMLGVVAGLGANEGVLGGSLCCVSQCIARS
jgi:hypothetical protein